MSWNQVCSPSRLDTNAEIFELDLAHPDHPAMAVRVSSEAKLAETEDGSFLEVTINNNLPCVCADRLNTDLSLHICIFRSSQSIKLLLF